jgi:hypothetical protein
MRAIAPSMPPHVCPYKAAGGPRRDFVPQAKSLTSLVAVYGLNTGSVCPRQGRRRPTPSFFAAGAGGVTTDQSLALACFSRLGAFPVTRNATKNGAFLSGLPFFLTDLVFFRENFAKFGGEKKLRPVCSNP